MTKTFTDVIAPKTYATLSAAKGQATKLARKYWGQYFVTQLHGRWSVVAKY